MVCKLDGDCVRRECCLRFEELVNESLRQFAVNSRQYVATLVSRKNVQASDRRFRVRKRAGNQVVELRGETFDVSLLEQR